MIFAYVLLLILAAFGVRFGKNEDYLSRDLTAAVKGFFVLVVFFNHFAGYAKLGENRFDSMYLTVNGWIGQLLVVMFLFYSGYGIYHQILNTDGKYIKTFLKRRFLPTWIQFAVCVTFFLILDLALGTLGGYTLPQILLSYTGWESIGNSNWFMFDTFVLYIVVWLAFTIFKKNRLHALILVTAATAGLILVLYFVKESWWWNTVFCFPLGMWYRFFKERIDAKLSKRGVYPAALLILLAAFGGLWLVDGYVRSLGIGYCLLSALFALAVTALLMRATVGNRILRFFGAHVFSVYMLQRIPLILLENVIGNVYLYFAVSFACTVAIAFLFDFVAGKIRTALKKRSKV